MTTLARGNTGRLSVLFTPLSGTIALADVTCTITSPSAVPVSGTVVEAGVNNYYVDHVVDDLAELGVWTVLWESDLPSATITVGDSFTVVPVSSGATGRTSIRSVIDRIRRELNSTLRYEVNVLAANVSDSATVLTMTYDLPPSLQPGALLSVGLETCRVMSINAAAKEVTVIRGFFDSSAEAQTSGSEVWVNPRFTPTSIFEAMHDELASWPPELFRVDTYQAPIANGAQTVELPLAWATMYGMIDARYLGTDVPYYQGTTEMTSFKRVEGRIVRANPAVWTEGPTSGIYFRPIEVLNNGTVLLQAALPFDLSDFVYESDLVDDCGMQLSMLDVLTIGVKLRLMPEQEIGRSQRRGQDDSRRAEEVPPETAMVPFRGLYPIYMRRRTEEISKLRSLYPWRIA